MAISTIVIVILCLLLPLVFPSQHWFSVHGLAYLPISLSGLLLLIMISLSLSDHAEIFHWYDYGILALLLLYQGWKLIK